MGVFSLARGGPLDIHNSYKGGRVLSLLARNRDTGFRFATRLTERLSPRLLQQLPRMKLVCQIGRTAPEVAMAPGWTRRPTEDRNKTRKTDPVPDLLYYLLESVICRNCSGR